MMEQDVPIPVYFLEWSSTLQMIVDDISLSSISDDQTGSAAEGEHVVTKCFNVKFVL